MPPLSAIRPQVAAVCGLLCLAVILVFCQTGNHDFVNFDDDEYVYNNSHLNHGITWGGLVYYAYHWHAYTYHPLSTYSHMLDCQLFGLRAGGHHWMNIAFHAVTAVLLLLVLRQMTGRLWSSAVVAALFAVHPLRAESVAWISERKDVLSGLFFMLTLSAYVRYVRVPKAGRYAVVCAVYVLGLLAKPMLVTVPMVLLLLDYWPLRRWTNSGMTDESEPENQTEASTMERDSFPNDTAVQFAATDLTRPRPSRVPWHLVREKLPLLILALADCALTIRTQGYAIRPLEAVPCFSRLANAVAAWVNYLGCFFWPQDLAVLYPLGEVSIVKACCMSAVLVVISIAAICLRKRAPAFLVGWLWYLGMLVPVIGLLQVGGQSMADRYTYLPQIGLAIALVWAMNRLVNCLSDIGPSVRHISGLLAALLAMGILTALAVCAWRQTAYWRNSETLWIRDSLYPNSVGYYNHGLALAADNRHAEAIQQYAKAYEIIKTDEDILYSYGRSLEDLGRTEEAIFKYREVLKVNPKSASANERLAAILAKRGKSEKVSNGAGP
jgi:protein O-mannosyl-transferase